jgi:hypothetical protein
MALGSVGAQAQQTPCPFERASLVFTGSATDQARCLLRPVRRFGHLGNRLDALPSPLSGLVGQPAAVSKETLRRFLRTRNIKEEQIGGSLDAPLSRARDNAPAAPFARYFVIHDTSTPNFLNDSFPGNINEPGWRFNDFSRYDAVAHVFVNRVGASATKIGFSTPRRATKFESQVVGIPAKGLFLHVELIQPRRRDPRGGSQNDAVAPTPGFTESQLDRLALVYTAASIRRGSWLIPAYHSVLDAGLRNAHDDPQAFDLDLWARRLAVLLENLGER